MALSSCKAAAGNSHPEAMFRQLECCNKGEKLLMTMTTSGLRRFLQLPQAVSRICHGVSVNRAQGKKKQEGKKKEWEEGKKPARKEEAWLT